MRACLGPLQIDLLRAFELALIAVRCGIAHIDDGACWNGDASHFLLFMSEAHQRLHRAFQPHHFLNKGLHIFVRIAFELLPHILVFNQQLHP